MTFVKGKTGNPAGRPRKTRGSEAEEFRKYLSVEFYQRKGKIWRDLDKLTPLQRLNFICRLLPYFLKKAGDDTDQQGGRVDLADLLDVEEFYLVQRHRYRQRAKAEQAEERAERRAEREERAEAERVNIDVNSFFAFVERTGQRPEYPTICEYLGREPTAGEVAALQNELLRRKQQEREQGDPDGDTDSTTDTDQTEDNEQDTAGGTPDGHQCGNVATA